MLIGRFNLGGSFGGAVIQMNSLHGGTEAGLRDAAKRAIIATWKRPQCQSSRIT